MRLAVEFKIGLKNISSNYIILFRLEDNANLNNSVRYSTFGPRYNTNNANNNTTQPSQSYPTGILKKTSSPPRQLVSSEEEQYEARNDEVIRRVAEMKQILQVIQSSREIGRGENR